VRLVQSMCARLPVERAVWSATSPRTSLQVLRARRVSSGGARGMPCRSRSNSSRTDCSSETSRQTAWGSSTRGFDEFDGLFERARGASAHRH